MRVWFWLWLLLSVPAQGETLRLYDYHQHPPFNTGGEAGLSHELVKYLNEKLGGNPGSSSGWSIAPGWRWRCRIPTSTDWWSGLIPPRWGIPNASAISGPFR